MHQSYQDHFAKPSDALRYDRQQYGDRSYAQLLWIIEQEILISVISAMPAELSDYLDFACGTGRVLSFVEPYAESVTGIDMSASMLALARQRTATADLRCEDITDVCTPTNKYDLITTFRFMLNAEDELRRKVLRALALRLKNRDSRLILNNHGNPFSHKAIMWPYHRLRQRLLHVRYQPSGNYLSHPHLTRLIAEAGLEIVEIVGYGHLSSKALRILDFSTLLSVERRLASYPAIGKAGVNQIYVTRLLHRD